MDLKLFYVNDIILKYLINATTYILFRQIQTTIRLSWRLFSVGPKTTFSVRQQTVDWSGRRIADSSSADKQFREFPLLPISFRFLPTKPSLARSRREGDFRSIARERLSTHIFDCSVNMPKFIAQPSSSSYGHYVALARRHDYSRAVSRSRILPSRSNIVARVCSLRAFKVIRSY